MSKLVMKSAAIAAISAGAIAATAICAAPEQKTLDDGESLKIVAE